jgi:hypothetical protein
MSAMVSMRGLMARDLVPVGGVAVTRDTINHWLLDSMCCDGYHVPRAYNCMQPLCVPAAFPRQLLPGALRIYLPMHRVQRSLLLIRLTLFAQHLLREAALAASPVRAAAARLLRGYGLMVGC